MIFSLCLPKPQNSLKMCHSLSLFAYTVTQEAKSLLKLKKAIFCIVDGGDSIDKIWHTFLEQYVRSEGRFLSRYL